MLHERTRVNTDTTDVGIDDVWRLTTLDHPIPYSPTLEDAFLPGADAIVASVTSRLGVRREPGPSAG